jgi:glycosyltransferase involved in cell wall biosynthesis
MKLSVVIITLNEEANIARTLKSVVPLVAEGNGEIIIVDSGSTDRTCEIARDFGAKVYVEKWKGFAAQKNSAIEKATGEWILSLDADEEVSEELVEDVAAVLSLGPPTDWCLTKHNSSFPVRRANWSSLSPTGFYIPRRNLFLGRWIKRGGFYPDHKLRLFHRIAGRFEERAVHETARVNGATGTLKGDLIHHAYPTLSGYIEHMNRYSSLGAELAIQKNQTSRSIFAFFWNVLLRPRLTFFYNYVLRLGFLDGREGLLLHLYHSAYVSWKYAKAWEASRIGFTTETRRHGE